MKLQGVGNAAWSVAALMLVAATAGAQITVSVSPSENVHMDAGLTLYKGFTVTVTSTTYQGDLVFQFDSGTEATQAVFSPATVKNIQPGETVVSRLDLSVAGNVYGKDSPYTWNVEVFGNKGTEFLDAAELPVTVHSFDLTASPPSASIRAKGSATFWICKYAHPSGFTTNLWMRASGLPKNTTAVFTPDTMTANDDRSALKITTKANTPPGTYQIRIRGYSFTQSTSVTLVVAR